MKDTDKRRSLSLDIAAAHTAHKDGIDPQRILDYQDYVAGICENPVVAAERFFRPIGEWMKNPLEHRETGVEPILIKGRLPFLWRGRDALHPGQADVFEGIFKHKYRQIAVATGHGVGKTFLAKLLPIQWLITHYDGKVILTAADWPAIQRDLVPAISKAMKDANVRLEPLPTLDGYMGWGPEWYMLACSPDKPERASGKHARGGILVIVDEASHLDYRIFNALLSNLTSPIDCIALFGNPLHADGPFADILLGLRDRVEELVLSDGSGGTVTVAPSTWKSYHISTLESPNIRAHENLYPGLSSDESLAIAATSYKPGTPEYQSRILGVVPDQDAMAYIARSAIEACGKRPTCDWQDDTNLVLSGDVARSEVGDRTVDFVRGDHSAHALEWDRGLDEDAVIERYANLRIRFSPHLTTQLNRLVDILPLLETQDGRVSAKLRDALHAAGLPVLRGTTKPYLRTAAAQVVDAMHLELNRSKCSNIPAGGVHVDGGGLGSGLCDRLERLGYPPTVRVIASSTADDAQGCVNKRAECWQNMKKGLETLAVPPWMVSEMREIAGLRRKPEARGRLQMESKDSYKLRTERSPDVADAVSYSWYREAGDAAFGGLTGNAHLIHSEPIISEGTRTTKTGDRAKTWWLHPSGAPVRMRRAGRLCRACWLPRREAAAALWIHVDLDGYWAVYDALEVRAGLPVSSVWERILDKSVGHRYAVDVFSCPEGNEMRGDVHITDELLKLTRQGTGRAKAKKRPGVPLYVPPSHIAGVAGLDVIDSMVLATLAQWPGHAFWKDHPDMKAAEHKREQRIGIWPRDVLEAMSRARMTNRGWMNDMDLEEPESIVAAGGPIVRCLRLLAVRLG